MMMKMIRKISLLALLAIGAALALSACGGGSSSSAGDAVSESGSEAEVVEAAFPSGHDTDEVSVTGAKPVKPCALVPKKKAEGILGANVKVSERPQGPTCVYMGSGREIDLVPVDLLNGEHRSAAYLRMNPNGRVPLLDDDGFLLWESHAIMQYLADSKPNDALYPLDLQPRADVNRWLFWSAYHFTPAVGRISRERVSKKMVGGAGGPDPVEIERGEAELVKAAQMLDEHLADKEWIAQGRLTLADVALAAPLMHTEAAQLPVLPFAHLQAWFGRVTALDAWRACERLPLSPRSAP